MFEVRKGLKMMLSLRLPYGFVQTMLFSQHMFFALCNLSDLWVHNANIEGVGELDSGCRVLLDRDDLEYVVVEHHDDVLLVGECYWSPSIASFAIVHPEIALCAMIL